MNRPWTAAHRREALRLLLRVAERSAGVVPAEMIKAVRLGCRSWMTEAGFRRKRAQDRVDPARIDREVRRVRDLAEGRLVRETTFDVVTPRGIHEERRATREEAREACAVYQQSHRVVRVTRIRRAVVP